MSATYHELDVIRETLEIFKLLLDSEEGEFIRDRAFADALMGYVSTMSACNMDQSSELLLVEVLFAVSTKLRLSPEVLPAWFKPAVSREALPQESSREDFLLFYLTMNYIHHEGKVGDFARTGLLYLIESAGQWPALEQWIIESDLALLMASGLGALYSQLSRWVDWPS